jgi:hypothetical protein
MIPTAKRPYVDAAGNKGELRVGWASWDEGRYEARSAKWAYKGKDGRVARTSPELSLDVLVEMLAFAFEQGELSPEQVNRVRGVLLSVNRPARPRA